jgi:hypothetical protein
MGKQRAEVYVCFCICQSFPRVGLSCSRCGGVVHGRAHAGIDAEGWAKHGPPGSPETHVGGARTRAYRRSADKGLRRWLNRCKEPACCSSRTWGRKRNRRPPRCCFPSVLHTPIRPHARPNNRVLRPTSSETYKEAPRPPTKIRFPSHDVRKSLGTRSAPTKTFRVPLLTTPKLTQIPRHVPIVDPSRPLWDAQL